MQKHALRAFTLVELMVVLGIIALLIAILLPALTRAREQARTTACLSNLQQIGLGIQMYAGDNHGKIVPYDYFDPTTTPTIHDNWATILIDGKYLTAPDQTGSGADSRGRSVFRCPSGANIKWTTITPSPIMGGGYSQIGAEFWRVKSTLSGKTYDIWYAANAANDSAIVNAFPMNPLPVPGTKNYRQVKLTQIHHAEDLVLIYDGVGEHFGEGDGYTQINARHDGRKDTNLLFADGHAQTYPRAQLPSKNDEMKTLEMLNQNDPFPHWRLDQ